MARVKQTITQRDFSAGVTREDLLEREDLEIRARSLRGGCNIRLMATGAKEARPGMRFLQEMADARKIFEITPAQNEKYLVALFDDKIVVLEEDLTEAFSDNSVGWSDGSSLWYALAGPSTVIGSPDDGLFVLEYDGATWALDTFTFDVGAGGSILQPYWPFHPGTTITPSGRSGSITITASADVFQAGHVGENIRYGEREITITAVSDAQNASGTTVNTLPPSFRVTVGDTSEIRVGDTVIGQVSGWQGVVSSIVNATQFTALTIDNYDGPTGSEEVSAPATTQTISSRTGISPVASTIWDEPLMSDVRGYARSGEFAQGRLILSNFPEAPNVVALSSARKFTDYRDGAEDADAIVRGLANAATRFLHVIEAGDLLLLSDAGIYFIELRDGGIVSPSTFNPVLLDARGASEVVPVRVDDGVVFVEANGQTISAALLDGSVYLKWTVRQLTEFHDDLISSPVALCGPSLTAIEPEKYLFAINDDGTLAALSWGGKFGEREIGWVPWETEGQIRFVAPAFGGYWCTVDRDIDGSTVRYLERFDYTALVDSMVEGNPNTAGIASHLVAESADVVVSGRSAGTGTVVADGSVSGMTAYTSAQVGLNFTASALYWPVENIESPRFGTITVRAFRFIVSVQHTDEFQIRCNNHTRTVAGYSFGDDLDEAPPLRTKVYRAPVTGRPEHPEMEIIKSVPGKLRILYAAQEVQG